MEELMNFDWDTDVSGSVKVESSEKDKDENNKTENNKTEESNEKNDEDEKLNNFDFEENEVEDDDNEEDDDSKENLDNKKKSKENKEVSIYTDLYKDLKDKKIFSFVDVDEDTDLDEDTFFELQEEEINKRVESSLLNWAEKELDEDAKNLIKYVRNGGNTKDFLEIMNQTSDLPEGDINDTKFQEKVIRFQLEEEGWEEDEIEDRLEYLADNDRLEKTAKKYFDRIKETKEKEKEDLLKQAEINKKEVEKRKLAYKQELKETLSEFDEVKGFKLSDKDKSNLFNFLTREEYRLQDGRVITGFQKKLSEVYQDKEKLILLAKLVNNDFDFSSIEKKATTKKIKEVKSNLEQRKRVRPSSSGSSTYGVTKSLADLFD